MKDAGIEAIKQLGEELKRLHCSVDRQDSDLTLGIDGREILIKKMAELNNCLMEIAKRHNGLEY